MKEDKLKRFDLFNNTATAAIQETTKFDSKIVESNAEYIVKLNEADATEYELLMKNMEIATSEQERQAIRDRMVGKI